MELHERFTKEVLGEIAQRKSNQPLLEPSQHTTFHDACKCKICLFTFLKGLLHKKYSFTDYVRCFVSLERFFAKCAESCFTFKNF